MQEIFFFCILKESVKKFLKKRRMNLLKNFQRNLCMNSWRNPFKNFTRIRDRSNQEILWGKSEVFSGRILEWDFREMHCKILQKIPLKDFLVVNNGFPARISGRISNLRKVFAAHFFPEIINRLEVFPRKKSSKKLLKESLKEILNKPLVDFLKKLLIEFLW